MVLQAQDWNWEGGGFSGDDISCDDIRQLGGCPSLPVLLAFSPMFLESLWNYCQCPTPGEHLFRREPPRLCHRARHPRDQMDLQGE